MRNVCIWASHMLWFSLAYEYEYTYVWPPSFKQAMFESPEPKFTSLVLSIDFSYFHLCVCVCVCVCVWDSQHKPSDGLLFLLVWGLRVRLIFWPCVGWLVVWVDCKVMVKYGSSCIGWTFYFSYICSHVFWHLICSSGYCAGQWHWVLWPLGVGDLFIFLVDIVHVNF